MTPTTRVLIVANVTVWSAIGVLACVWLLNRIHHSHGRTLAREPKEAPRSAPATVATARHLLLLLVPGTLRDRTPQHEGATERYGAELRALRDLPPTPELTTAPEQMVADHQALHTIGEAIAHFDQVIEAELDRFLSGMPLVRMRLPACAGATGEFARGELDELLAVTG